MKLDLAYLGNPILRKKGTKVSQITPEIVQLITDMTETMIAHNGIGLAAPQVNKSLALFITQVPIKVSEDPEDHEWEEGDLRVFINPKILDHSPETWVRDEGCLSIPGVYGNVERPVKIRIQATDLKGNLFEEVLDWLPARAFMHENDHINGILFLDRLDKEERRQLDHEISEVKKKYRS